MASTSQAAPVVPTVGGMSPELAQQLKALNVRPGEYQKILNHLEREPNFTELCMFSAMWSEHCCYKHTRHLLKRLPTEGEHILQGPGENAGLVDAGDGIAVAFKVESHNHPTYVEPFQGATTGVGGILRDIITMNARPVALLNALRFGPLEHSTTSRQHAANKYRFFEAVAGIAHYGNCTGIPTIGGDVFFHPTYGQNPLVNAMAIGVLQHGGMMASGAHGVGNPVLYVGSPTGRDGMGGAAFASRSLNETKRAEDRPAVQVGDPFAGKLLLESILESFQTGAVVAAQDMGAAGLTCATCEMATKGDIGMSIDLDKVPTREPGMVPWEYLSSESQERFLLVLEKGREAEVMAVFEKWQVLAVVIGEVIDQDRIWVHHKGERVVDLPAKLLTQLAPSYDPASRPEEPKAAAERRKLDPRERFKDSLISDLPELLTGVMAPTGNLALPTEVFRQYDRHVRNNTRVSSEHNMAGVIRLENADGLPTQRGLAATLDGNHRYTALEPYNGTMAAVAESVRNLVCSGAKPLAVTNNLNYGDPEEPDVYYQLYFSVEGMRDACLAFGTPITGGNVSLYNTHDDSAILPSPVIGMVGTIDDIDAPRPMGHYSGHGAKLALVGRFRPSLGATEYQFRKTGQLFGAPPSISIRDEVALANWLLEKAIPANALLSLQDVSLGGLLYTALQGAWQAKGPSGQLTISVDLDLSSLRQTFPHYRVDELLFGETQGSYVISYLPENEAALKASFDAVATDDWTWIPLGTLSNAKTTGQPPTLTLTMDDETTALPLANLAQCWQNGLSADPPASL